MDIDKLVGETVSKIDKSDDKLIFHCISGNTYIMFHDQDCCEDVQIEDICGDLDDLIGSPILKATEDTNRDNPKTRGEEPGTWVDESYTWTFYNITTQKGTVTIRWYGTSNGYYSEGVDFELLNTKGKY